MNSSVLNWVIVALLVLGAVFLAEKLASMDLNSLAKLATQAIQYASIPIALLLKLGQLVNAELKRISDIRELALSNRNSDESMKEQLAFIRSELLARHSESSEGIRGLDRRMIRLEAKAEVATRLERQERLIQEITERLNKNE